MIRVVRTARLRALAADAAEVRERLRQKKESTDAAAAETGAEIGRLKAALAEALRAAEGPCSLVVLLHWGEVHSVHTSVQAAEECAAAHGAEPSGWGPSTALPARRVVWRTLVVTVTGGDPCPV